MKSTLSEGDHITANIDWDSITAGQWAVGQQYLASKQAAAEAKAEDERIAAEKAAEEERKWKGGPARVKDYEALAQMMTSEQVPSIVKAYIYDLRDQRDLLDNVINKICSEQDQQTIQHLCAQHRAISTKYEGEMVFEDESSDEEEHF